MIDLHRALRTASTTGKVYLGAKQTEKALKEKKVMMIIVSSNCPEEVVERVQRFSVPFFRFDGTSLDLGSACGKPFPVSILSVIEPGESNILSIIK